jgi:hypothetical protein
VFVFKFASLCSVVVFPSLSNPARSKDETPGGETKEKPPGEADGVAHLRWSPVVGEPDVTTHGSWVRERERKVRLQKRQRHRQP